MAQQDVITCTVNTALSPMQSKHYILHPAAQRAPKPLCFAAPSFNPFFLGLSAGRLFARAPTSSSKAGAAGAALLPLALGARAPAPQATHCCAIHLVSCASSAWCSVLRAHQIWTTGTSLKHRFM